MTIRRQIVFVEGVASAAGDRHDAAGATAPSGTVIG
jgi:hypothetical protein